MVYIRCVLSIPYMKVRHLNCLLLLVLLSSCLFQNNTKNAPVKMPADTLTATVTDDGPLNYNDCVFDTSAYKFTSEKLFAYQKNIQFTWDSSKARAVAALNEHDTLTLQIGGCTIFYWTATLTTDSSAFYNHEYLIKKSAWLAATFLGSGFDSKFHDCISNGQFTFDSTGKDMKYLTITNTDTAITNKTYEDVTFELKGNRTTIIVGGYED